MAEFKKETYTVRQLAAKWEMDESTIYKMLKRGELIHMRISCGVRIPVSAVIAYEEEHTICPAPNLTSQYLPSEELKESPTYGSGGRIIVVGAFQRAQRMKRKLSSSLQTI